MASSPMYLPGGVGFAKTCRHRDFVITIVFGVGVMLHSFTLSIHRERDYSSAESN